MSVLNILFVGSDDVARSIAKKSDSRDVDNYVYKDLKRMVSFPTISILGRIIILKNLSPFSPH